MKAPAIEVKSCKDCDVYKQHFTRYEVDKAFYDGYASGMREMITSLARNGYIKIKACKPVKING